MTQTPPPSTCELADAARLFIDASTVAAFNGQPPNKFTRLVEALTRDIPGAVVGTMTSDGFIRQDIVSFDTTPGYKSIFLANRDESAITHVRRVASWTPLWRRTRMHAIVGLLWLAPNRVKASLRNAGAYILATSYRIMSNAERQRFYAAFEVEDLARETKFAWWLKDDIEAARAKPFFRETKELIEVREHDIVVFYGLAGGIRPPTCLKRSTSKQRYKVVCLLLDLSPLLSPGITGRISTTAARNALMEFAEASDLIIVPSEAVANGLKQLLDDTGTRCPDVSIVNTFLGLSPDGVQSSVSTCLAGRFVLTVTSFKRRKNVYWLMSAWKAAARAAANPLPHLVIVSSGSDDGYGWLLPEDEFLSTRVTIVKSPTDRELRWLFTNAAFVIQPPAQGGLGIAAMEALFFHKTVLCERHPANANLEDNPLVYRLNLDMDLWVDAIIKACADADVERQETFSNHAQYARQYATDLTACFDSLSDTTRFSI